MGLDCCALSHTTLTVLPLSHSRCVEAVTGERTLELLGIGEPVTRGHRLIADLSRSSWLERNALSTGLCLSDGWYQKCRAKHIFLCRLSNAAWAFPGPRPSHRCTRGLA